MQDDTLARNAFAGYSVEVFDSDSPPPDIVAERVKISVEDQDPNGLGLLGVDNSPGKDTGNIRLDENLSGLNMATRARGRSPYGGVFLGEFFTFSRKLNPNSAMADPGFDALFGPFSPALGGRAPQPGDSDSPAIEALAALLAETLVHECGHALGMAAGTPGSHHEGDQPNWRMDEGKFRSFSERAGLGAPQQWGPIDAAYLAKILPKL